MLYFVFADLDECNTHTHNCDINADCANTVGSYSCTCKVGYTGNGQNCNGESKKPTSHGTNKLNALGN